MHQAPEAGGQTGTRWTLASLLASCDWLRLKTRGGLSRLLRRLGIHRKRARAHVHSPDPHYRDKLALVRLALTAAQRPAPRVFLFQDEITLYRQPSVASAYERAGHTQPLAELGWKSNTTWRIAALLNAWTGQVTYLAGYRITIPRLVTLYQQVVTTYGATTPLDIAQDNWPVHFHPNVLAALQPQTNPFPWVRPAKWPTEPSPTARALNLPIRLLSLPTYASWTNPIEKLWRWLRQEVIHLHRHRDDWPGLQRAVTQFLDQFAHGSPALLRYVGLAQPLKLYQSLFPTDGGT